MKKYLGLLAFPIMLMTGCAKENTIDITPDNPDNNPVEKVLTFTGIINGTNNSRTAFGEYNKGEYGVFWTGGDNISVYTKSGKLQKFDLTGGAGSAKGTFTFVEDVAEVATSNAHYAVYPHTLNTSDYDGGHNYNYSFNNGTLTLDLSNLAVQTYNEADDQAGADKFQLTKSVMTAKSTDTTLKFENALAMLHVNICAGEDENFENFTVHKIELTVKNGQPLWGAGATIDMNSSNPKAVIPASTDKNVITLMIPKGALVSEDCAELGGGNNHDSNYNYNLGGRDFYILLPAGTYENFQINALVSYDQRGAAEDGTKKFEFNLKKRWDEITFDRSYINSFHRPIDALISYNGVVYADILDAYAAAKENGEQEVLELEIAREGKLYWPFFECYERVDSKIPLDVYLNGEGKTLTIANPNLDPVYFTSYNGDTNIENLNVDGEISLIGLGQYIKDYADFHTVLNNVKVNNADVNFYSNGAVRTAMFNYGLATLNNCEVIGNKKSPNCPWISGVNNWKEFDTFNDPETFTYDLGAGNKTKTYLNGGTYGNIITWEYNLLDINGADVQYLCVMSCIHTSGVKYGGFKVDGTEEDPAIIGRIDLVGDPGNYSNLHTNVYVGKNCTIDALNLTSTVVKDNTRKIVIEDLNVINEIIFDGESYTKGNFKFKPDSNNNIIVFGSGEETKEFTLSLGTWNY